MVLRLSVLHPRLLIILLGQNLEILVFVLLVLELVKFNLIIELVLDHLEEMEYLAIRVGCFEEMLLRVGGLVFFGEHQVPLEELDQQHQIALYLYRQEVIDILIL